MHQPKDRENAYASLLTGSMIFLLCLLFTAFCALNALDHVIEILPSYKFRLSDNIWKGLLSLTGSIAAALTFSKGVLYSCRMISTQIRFLKRAG